MLWKKFLKGLWKKESVEVSVNSKGHSGKRRIKNEQKNKNCLIVKKRIHIGRFDLTKITL
jgi:hypothetical protein